jgi:aspartyl aminopeptidase
MGVPSEACRAGLKRLRFGGWGVTKSDTTRILQFFDAGISASHVATELDTRLREAGSRVLPSGETWSVTPGELVHTRLDGTVVAYRAGTAEENEASLLLAAAHTDSPGLHLKDRSATVVDGLLQVPVEVYGGPILATWLDRELLIVGKIAIRGEAGFPEVRLFSSRRPLAIIPNLAIHLNREVNNKLTYNRQDHLKALIPLSEEETTETPRASDPPGQSDSRGQNGGRAATSGYERFRQEIAVIAGVDPAELLDMELQLVPTGAATRIGGLVVSPRIDNLGGCVAVLDGLCSASALTRHGQIAVFFDHEEIGSTTAYGAAGDVTRRFVSRVLRGQYGASVDVDAILSRSVLVSNDAAHARHPNYADKHDGGYAPVLGAGPVIKKSAIRRYASELSISAWFAALCSDIGVSVQYLQNRSDIMAGSTIGPAVASRLSVPSVDVGIPMLSMHSIRETAALNDITAMQSVFREIFTRGYAEVTK